MQIEQFHVDTTLPILNGNFEALKQSLTDHLVRYEIEVNESNFNEAEQMEKDLTKLARQIDNKRKEVAGDVKKPIDFFNDKCKELINLCENAKSKIIEQTQAFKDKRQKTWQTNLQNELLAVYANLKIQDEFKTVIINDLAIKSNFTEIGNLTKSTKDEINKRACHALYLQGKVYIRLVELENLSLKAGLKSPLERRHIETFLKSEDQIYATQLNKIFENEIKRQKEIEDQIIANQKREQEKREAQIRAEEENKRQAELERIQKEQAEKQRLENEIKVKETEIKTIVSEIPTNPRMADVSVNKNEDSIIEIKQKLYIDEDGGEYGEERRRVSIVVNNNTLFRMHDGICPEDAYFNRDLNGVYNIFPTIQKSCQYVKDGFGIRFVEENYLVDQDDNDLLQNTKIVGEIKPIQQVIKPLEQEKTRPTTNINKTNDGENTFIITLVCKVATKNDADSTKQQFLEALEKAGVKNSIQSLDIKSVG